MLCFVCWQNKCTWLKHVTSKCRGNKYTSQNNTKPGENVHRMKVSFSGSERITSCHVLLQLIDALVFLLSQCCIVYLGHEIWHGCTNTIEWNGKMRKVWWQFVTNSIRVTWRSIADLIWLPSSLLRKEGTFQGRQSMSAHSQIPTSNKGIRQSCTSMASE